MTETVNLAVNGTLMRGLELNKNLIAVGATFLRETHTKPLYRLFSIDDRYPAMIRVTEGGSEITLEIWSIPLASLYQIIQQEPSGLCIGKIVLVDESEVLGVLGEAIICEKQLDITQYGGWRKYLASKRG
jgi:gamma-glutamylcyclotransferase (GGCT)/AIG2-like uncharacterized protein YtfP